MKIAHYIGDHTGDSLMARAGWSLTRLVQKGPYGHITHVEAIHGEYSDGSVIIAGASLRDKGVRAKNVRLNPEHWMITDVPQWHVDLSVRHLERTKGSEYDWRGAVATAFIGSQNNSTWFCNEWVGFPYLKSAANFGPNTFAAVCFSFGKDVTTEFFNSRKEKA